MISNKPFENANGLVDQAAAGADHAIKSTQRATNEALDALSGGVQDLRNHAGPMVHRSSEQIAALAQRGIDAVHDGSQRLRDTARSASDSTVSYIRDEPIKSVLIAAATGAALVALMNLLMRSRHGA